ncbi:MAG: hypothetical protein AB1610_03350 [Nitrospirota bacterium]
MQKRLDSIEILSYDFPQSGTGISLQPNQAFRQPETKNEGVIIPDIIAFKDGIGLISENKPYFEKQDIDKLEKIRDGIYSESLNKVFRDRQINKLVLGIVLPNILTEISKAQDYFVRIDFVFVINAIGSCDVEYLLEGITL